VRRIASRLLACLRDTDTIARLAATSSRCCCPASDRVPPPPRWHSGTVGLVLRYVQAWLLRHVDGADRDFADALHRHAAR
jgi:hypothetical protein